jgi:peptidoglycan hydrolase CwlO-like protein
MNHLAIGDKITYGRTHGKKYEATVVKLNKLSYKVLRKEGDYLIQEYVKPDVIIGVERQDKEVEVMPSQVNRLQKENTQLKHIINVLQAEILSLKSRS